MFKPGKTIKKAHCAYQSISIYIYYISLALIVTGLLFSRGMLSTGFISFIANWIIEGSYKEKWETLKKNKVYSIISLIFVIHLIGLIHTQQFELGVKELKVKLPLLLPIFYFSSIKLIKSINTHYFILLFIASTAVASLFGFFRFEFFSNYQTVEDLNQIALVGQNIRLSLFVNLSIFATLYYLFSFKFKKAVAGLLIISLIWLTLFLYLLNSLTGHITFVFLLLFCLFFVLKKSKKLVLVTVFTILVTGAVFCVYVANLVDEFNKVELIDFKKLKEKTKNGNDYYHNIKSKRIENGHYVDIYICPEELKKEWQKVSEYEINGKDSKGQDLYQTLLRYLSSKGLRKDSTDFQKLTNKDIAYIENGCSNYKYTKKYSLEARIYNILWQLNTYNQTGNATAQSISQRIEFLKIAKKMIIENFWFGVGPGDVMDDFSKELDKSGSKLETAFHNRVHNQYIVEFVALGVIGFIVFIFLTFYPVFKFKAWNHYLFSVFYLIILLSYFTDNTLETQLGVSFYSLFFCLVMNISFQKRPTLV